MHSQSPAPGPRNPLSCPRVRDTDFAAFAADRTASEWAPLRAHYPRCADCAREVAHWSRLASLLRSEEGDMGAHPSEQQLLAYQSKPGALAPGERAFLEAHLAGCAPCRSELRVLAGFDFAALAPAASAPVQGAAQTRAPGERRTGVLDTLGERLFGLASRPAWALAAVLLVVVPAAVLGWWIGRRAAPAADAPPVARIEAPDTSRLPPAPSVPEERPAPVAVAQDEPARGAPNVVEPAPTPDTAVDQGAPEVALRTGPPEPTAPERSEPPPAPPESVPLRIAALLPSELPRYVPDAALAGGSLEEVRVEPIVRGGVAGALPVLRALAPPHVGATAAPAPVLYWHLSAASPVPIEIAIFSEDDEAVSLLDLRLEPPVAAGLHVFRFSEHALRMAPGVTWHWSVALVPDRDKREEDVLAGAAVRHTPLGAELRSELDAAPRAERAHRLAAAGYWFDAFTTLSAWSEAEPLAANLRAQRAALLEQVALGELAAELGGAPVR